MCLILFSYREHPDYPFIFAANRDEFYSRPTDPAAFWEDRPDLMGGRDRQAGGTWCGLTRAGRFSAITNIREPEAHDPGAPSRGQLVVGFLAGTEAPQPYLERLASVAGRYNGFNLLVGHPGDLCYLSNREGRVRRVAPGLHGLSNHLLDTPWPKVVRGKEALRAAIDAGRITPAALFDVLADDVQAPDETLPRTGVDVQWERALSPVFIRTQAYGTRASTVLLIHRSGQAVFAERTYGAQGAEGTRRYEFTVPSWDASSTADDPR